MHLSCLPLINEFSAVQHVSSSSSILAWNPFELYALHNNPIAQTKCLILCVGIQIGSGSGPELNYKIIFVWRLRNVQRTTTRLECWISRQLMNTSNLSHLSVVVGTGMFPNTSSRNKFQYQSERRFQAGNAVPSLSVSCVCDVKINTSRTVKTINCDGP